VRSWSSVVEHSDTDDEAPGRHERFRGLCVDLAQFMYRSEVKLRTNILGEPPRHIRPLSEAKCVVLFLRAHYFPIIDPANINFSRAIENGANTIAEGFLFAVAAGLILGESWRTSRNQSKRSNNVDDRLDELHTKVTELTDRVDSLIDRIEVEMREEKLR
jgi:optic atrophy 3 protein